MAVAEKRLSRGIAIVVGIVVAVLVSAGVKALLEHRGKDRRRTAQAEEWGLERKASDRIEDLVNREMLPLMTSPLFKKRLQQEIAANKGQPVDDKSLGRYLVARGAARLSDDDLLAFHALRKRTVFGSERACPCYWDSTGCTDADVMDGLSRLTDLELTAWLRLSASAGLAELAATQPLPATRSTFDAGLRDITNLLPPKERDDLTRTMEATSPAPRAQQCAAVRAVFSGADRLQPGPRLAFIRAFTNLGAKE
jgi:hypothetical protein